MTQARTGLALDPLDVLFFRDGRPFEAGGQARSGLPWPQTFAGALRTWLLAHAGCDFERLGHAIRAGAPLADALADGQPPEAAAIAHVATCGPWLALAADDGATELEPLVPAPASLRKEKDGKGKNLVRSDPLREPLPGWTPEFEGELPVWPRTRARTRPARGWLRAAGLRAFLDGGAPSESGFIDVEEEAPLFGLDHRTGIEVEPDRRSAAEGLIYSVSLLALRPRINVGSGRARVVLYAEAAGPQDVIERLPKTSTPLALGGEGRHVAMRRTEPFSWPSAAPRGGAHPLLLLTSPGIFDAGWRPSSVTCVAGVVPEAAAVSGWDLARGGPKPTRFAAPAGSVYFARELPAGFSGSLGSADDTALGYGTTLIGSWQYA